MCEKQKKQLSPSSRVPMSMPCVITKHSAVLCAFKTNSSYPIMTFSNIKIRYRRFEKKIDKNNKLFAQNGLSHTYCIQSYQRISRAHRACLKIDSTNTTCLPLTKTVKTKIPLKRVIKITSTE